MLGEERKKEKPLEFRPCYCRINPPTLKRFTCCASVPLIYCELSLTLRIVGFFEMNKTSASTEVLFYLIFIHAGLKHLSNVWREGCFSRKPIMRSLFLFFFFFLKKINNLEERITGGSWRCRMANCREDLWSLIVLQYAGSKGFSHAAHKLKDQLGHETMPCFYSLKYFAVCHSVK